MMASFEFPAFFEPVSGYWGCSDVVACYAIDTTLQRCFPLPIIDAVMVDSFCARDEENGGIAA